MTETGFKEVTINLCKSALYILVVSHGWTDTGREVPNVWDGYSAQQKYCRCFIQICQHFSQDPTCSVSDLELKSIYWMWPNNALPTAVLYF